jgi:hypothetical protein
MLLNDASVKARLLRTGEIVAAYVSPDNFPISLGAYIIEPG